MNEVWTLQRIEQMIQDGIQEHAGLDYKAAAALQKDSKKVTELQKDVSAFANSAGGTLIYGVTETKPSDGPAVPDRIDAIDTTTITREWLETHILQIKPRILGVKITPVAVDPADPRKVVYVVDIPEGSTAHQVPRDLRYYRRFDFQSVPMEDYEVRLVMQRGNTPILQPHFALEITERTETPSPALRNPNAQAQKRITHHVVLELRLENVGQVYAQHAVCRLKIPTVLLPKKRRNTEEDWVILRLDNQDVGRTLKYAGKHRPILPNSTEYIGEYALDESIAATLEALDECEIHWRVHADNALPREGAVKLIDLPTTKRYEQVSSSGYPNLFE